MIMPPCQPHVKTPFNPCLAVTGHPRVVGGVAEPPVRQLAAGCVRLGGGVAARAGARATATAEGFWGVGAGWAPRAWGGPPPTALPASPPHALTPPPPSAHLLSQYPFIHSRPQVPQPNCCWQVLASRGVSVQPPAGCGVTECRRWVGGSGGSQRREVRRVGVLAFPTPQSRRTPLPGKNWEAALAARGLGFGCTRRRPVRRTPRLSKGVHGRQRAHGAGTGQGGGIGQGQGCGRGWWRTGGRGRVRDIRTRPPPPISSPPLPRTYAFLQHDIFGRHGRRAGRGRGRERNAGRCAVTAAVQDQHGGLVGGGRGGDSQQAGGAPQDGLRRGGGGAGRKRQRGRGAGSALAGAAARRRCSARLGPHWPAQSLSWPG